MKRLVAHAVLALVPVFAPLPVHASDQDVFTYFSNGEFVEECRNKTNNCFAYLAGLYDGVITHTFYMEDQTFFCKPRAVTAVELSEKYLEEYEKDTSPDKDQQSASGTALMAFENNYACQN